MRLYDRLCSRILSALVVTLSICSTVSLSATSTSSPVSAAADQSVSFSGTNPRPLHQNWWPVSLESSLDREKPNAVEVLNKKLVLFHDGKEWNCLDDKCSHRFAPLSEGRVTVGSSNERCLQCAYHGWEFNGKGASEHIPQLSASDVPKSSTSRGRVRSYPVREGAEMVWVWADSDSSSLPIAKNVSLPISPLLEEFVKDYPGSCFTRDLPYGFELLGENLLDISHLPFSHHNVGGFFREDARPLRLRMLSSMERLENCDDEVKAMQINGDSAKCYPAPIFQVEVQNASQTDPTLLARSRRRAVAANSVATSGFYDPCHIRYRRLFGGRGGSGANIELFLSPIAPGKSRVFLINTFERFLVRNLKKSVEKQKSWIGRLKQRFINSRIRVIVGGSGWQGHMVAHDIFDGDGIFLNKQGDRMNRDGVTHRDYYTPSSADLLVKSFRRWLDAAAETTSTYGPQGVSAAAAAVGQDVPGEQVAYLDRDERERMLDRYSSHTKNCKVCSRALLKFERKKARMDAIVTALMGTLGASVGLLSSFCVLALSRTTYATAAKAVLGSAGVVALGSCLVAYFANQRRRALAKQIQKFYFVDYIHAQM